jgi:hypothetical protein
MENSRREAAFKADCADALKAAEPAKAAQDHRLRIQIRESESLISTLDRKILDIRQLLKSL